MLLKKIAHLALGVSLLAFASCANMNNGDNARTPINSTCPAMADHAVDPECGVMHGEHWVAFCCAKCKPAWDKMSDEDKAAYVAKSLAAKK